MTDIYLQIAGQQMGPLTSEQVRQLIASGQATAATLAWRPGLPEWQALGAMSPELFATASPPMPPVPAPRKGMHPGVIAAIIVAACFVGLAVLSCLAGIALGPITAGINNAKRAVTMQRARQIGLAMFAYEVDHNGQYPTGKTSTEVFQKLLDEKYISDPATFYFSLPGKEKPTTAHLTADNVCFDVTSGITTASADGVPLVFTTGYTVSYGTMITAQLDASSSRPGFLGMEVCYKNNSARMLPQRITADARSIVLATSIADGQTYTQLRP